MSTSTSMTTVSENSEVKLHFALKLEDDQMVDSTFDGDPAQCVIGDGSLLPGFEAYVIGMTQGQRQQFHIPPEEAFGQPNPQNIQDMKRADFPVDMPIAPGLMVSFSDAHNAELPGTIAKVDGDWVSVDFNHPLAGKTIIFDVEIVEVMNAN